MFVSTMVPALFKKGTLKLVPATDGPGMRRVAEATLIIEPFPAHLAHELGEDIAGHLFGVDDQIRPELEGIDLRVRAGLQNVTARHHEELDPCARLSPVSIKDVSVARHEDENRVWLSLSFVLMFSLEGKAARNFILDEFGRTLVWTFESLQRELLTEAALHESIAKLADPAGDGSMTASFGIAGEEMHTIDAKAHKQKAKELREKAERQTH